MWFGVVSLFPEMFSAVTESGVTRRACEKGLISVTCFNPRDYAYDKYKTVDDKPYGGGPGMLMKVEPLVRAVEDLNGDHGMVILTSPRGERFTQAAAGELARMEHLIVGAGH